MEIDLESNKTLFLEIYKKYIKRDGADKLLNWLLDEKKSDFFTAPASSKFHLDVAGGLCQHSLNVYNNLKRIVALEKEVHPENKQIQDISEESMAICALLHDLCKVNFYKVELRNVKNEFGQWEKVPYFATDEKFPMGHGEKSVFICMMFLQLTGEEIAAINWHMGGFDERVKGGASKSISAAYEMYPLAVFLQAADFISSYIDETRA